MKKEKSFINFLAIIFQIYFYRNRQALQFFRDYHQRRCFFVPKWNSLISRWRLAYIKQKLLEEWQGTLRHQKHTMSNVGGRNEWEFAYFRSPACRRVSSRRCPDDGTSAYTLWITTLERRVSASLKLASAQCDAALTGWSMLSMHEKTDLYTCHLFLERNL